MAERVKSTSLRSLLVVVLRVLVSGLFLTAGVLKLQDPDGTLVAVYQYKLISWEASGVVASFLPFAEIAAAVGLWIPRLRLGASLLCIALNLLFIAALGSAVLRNLDVSCGCFGTTDLKTTSGLRLLEDVLLLSMCFPLWRHALTRHYAGLHSGEESGY